MKRVNINWNPNPNRTSQYFVEKYNSEEFEKIDISKPLSPQFAKRALLPNEKFGYWLGDPTNQRVYQYEGPLIRKSYEPEYFQFHDGTIMTRNFEAYCTHFIKFGSCDLCIIELVLDS